MLDDEMTRLWLNYVRTHMHILEPSEIRAESELYDVRECMACMGLEITPSELQDLTLLLKDSIEYIRHTANRR